MNTLFHPTNGRSWTFLPRGSVRYSARRLNIDWNSVHCLSPEYVSPIPVHLTQAQSKAARVAEGTYRYDILKREWRDPSGQLWIPTTAIVPYVRPVLQQSAVQLTQMLMAPRVAHTFVERSFPDYSLTSSLRSPPNRSGLGKRRWRNKHQSWLRKALATDTEQSIDQTVPMSIMDMVFALISTMDRPVPMRWHWVDDVEPTTTIKLFVPPELEHVATALKVSADGLGIGLLHTSSLSAEDNRSEVLASQLVTVALATGLFAGELPKGFEAWAYEVEDLKELTNPIPRTRLKIAKSAWIDFLFQFGRLSHTSLLSANVAGVDLGVLGTE